MARRAVKATPPPAPVAGEGGATADPSADAGNKVPAAPPPARPEPKIAPALISGSALPAPGAQARAPALLITVMGLRPVFACGRWFQPGPATACPPGYFSARQVRDLQAHPGLSVWPQGPAPEAAP